MTQHVIGLNLEEQKAFTEQSFSHTVGVANLKEIVNERARLRSEQIGTGSTCDWKGKKIVLTAKHVVEGAGPSDIAFLPRGANALGWDSPGKFSAMVERVVVGVEEVVRCPWEDLAAIVLKPEGLESLNCEFCPLPKRLAVDSTVTNMGVVLVIGFPVDQTFEVSESRQGNGVTKLMACPCDSFWGEIVDTPERPLSSYYVPDRHFLIRYDPTNQHSRPQGYSGGAVWCDPTRRSVVWRADPLLLGIETHAYEKSGLLLAVRAGVVRRFLEESL